MVVVGAGLTRRYSNPGVGLVTAACDAQKVFSMQRDSRGHTSLVGGQHDIKCSYKELWLGDF